MRYPIIVAAALGLAAAALLGASAPQKTWKGYVTDTYCGLNRVDRPPTVECTRSCIKDQHAQYAFFNFADQKVYVLNPQCEAAKYAGQTVTVTGTIVGRQAFTTMKGADAGDVIAATKIAPAANRPAR